MEITEQGGRRAFRLAYRKYQTTEVVIPTSEDRVETYRAYVKTDGRYPVDVTIDLDEADHIYMRDAEIPPATDEELALSAEERAARERARVEALEPYERWEEIRRRTRAWKAYLVRVLCILVDGLTEDVARRLDPEEVDALLTELGFLNRPTGDDDAARPLARASTGATRSASSRAATPATTASSRDA